MSHSSPVNETPLPLADHDEIGRKVLTQPFVIQKAIVTIAAHCRVLVDKHPTGDVADIAACISQDCLELAEALNRHAQGAANPPDADWIDQNYQIDRYGVALMMIREGCSDPAGLARRILSEFDGSAHTRPDGETRS